MRALGLVAIVALAASVMSVGGCKETYNMTFTNVSGHALDVAIASPEETRGFGTVADGQRVTYTLKIDDRELPAGCQMRAGGMVKDFTLDKQMKKELYFYAEEKTIVGPLDKKMTVNKTSKEMHKAIKTEQNEMITGEKPAGAAPSTPAPSGGERIIDQNPVIE